MTLILSEVSHLGIAMAADSAITTEPGRVWIGMQKLLPIYKMNAGISLWGAAEIGNQDADIWLQNFIDNRIPNDISLWDAASLLATELNTAVDGVLSDRMGIHVGGFDIRDGIRGPAFYHIHNGHYHTEMRGGEVVEIAEESPPIREFRAHLDHTPRIYAPQDDPRLTRNGDFGIFAALHDRFMPILKDIQLASGMNFPHPRSLASRGEYLRFWINTIKEIYRLSNYRIRVLPEPATAGDASIGGPVTVLTISSSGIQSFYSK